MAMPTQSRPPGVPVYNPINMNLAICLKGRRSVRIRSPFEVPEWIVCFSR